MADDDGGVLRYWGLHRGQAMKTLGAVVGTVIVGLLLYSWRSRSRFWYGVAEVIAALFVVVLTMNPEWHSYTVLTTDDIPPAMGSWLSWVFGQLAGLYVFVRGMDNIGNGLSEAQRAPWRRLFGPHA